MWPFRRTRLASDTEVLAALTRLHTKVSLLEERIASAEDKHERLRGRVYATGAHKADPQPDAAPAVPKSKADILREFGYRPGQPAPHRS